MWHYTQEYNFANIMLVNFFFSMPENKIWCPQHNDDLAHGKGDYGIQPSGGCWLQPSVTFFHFHFHFSPRLSRNSNFMYSALKITTIYHAWDWLSFKQLCLSCLSDLWNLPGSALLSGFQRSQGASKSTWYKRVLSKCSFICNKGLVNIWNGHKARK